MKPVSPALSFKRIAVSALFLAGCSSTTVDSESRPNGQHRHKIQCRDSVGGCYEKAEDLCPGGYLVLNRVRAIKREDHTEFNLSIRCRGSRVFY